MEKIKELIEFDTKSVNSESAIRKIEKKRKEGKTSKRGCWAKSNKCMKGRC